MEATNIFLSKALSYEKEKKATKKGAHESYKTPIFAKDVYRRYLFFFISLRARSCELVDVFEKNEKKNKTTKERLFLYFSFSRARRCFFKERKEK